MSRGADGSRTYPSGPKTFVSSRTGRRSVIPEFWKYSTSQILIASGRPTFLVRGGYRNTGSCFQPELIRRPKKRVTTTQRSLEIL